MGVAVWNVLGVFIALLALSVTIWQGYLLRRQVSHTESLSRSQLYQQIVRQFVEMDAFFVDRPDIRQYLYDGQPMPREPKDRGRVLAAASMVVDLAESCTATESTLGRLSSDWDKYFTYLYAHSPALREYWAEHGRWYPERVWASFGLDYPTETSSLSHSRVDIEPPPSASV
jgi:hypothetical protein